MTDLDFETYYTIWQNDDEQAGASDLAQAEHFATVYGQDGPVECRTDVTFSFDGSLTREQIAQALARRDGVEGPVVWRYREDAAMPWRYGSNSGGFRALKEANPQYEYQPLYAHPAPATTPADPRPDPRDEALREARVREARLSEFENEDLSDEAARTWMGHVHPSLSRLRQALAKIKAVMGEAG
jgi:hypothetical protein